MVKINKKNYWQCLNKNWISITKSWKLYKNNKWLLHKQYWYKFKIFKKYTKLKLDYYSFKKIPVWKLLDLFYHYINHYENDYEKYLWYVIWIYIYDNKIYWYNELMPLMKKFYHLNKNSLW